jgi:hypothetical protein
MKLHKLGILTVVLVCGCQGYEFANDPVTGQKKVKDNSFLRWDFARDVDRQIKDELAGETPPRVDLTWNDWWVDLIDRQKKYLIGDSDFYITYIIDARRKAGLPELRLHKRPNKSLQPTAGRSDL